MGVIFRRWFSACLVVSLVMLASIGYAQAAQINKFEASGVLNLDGSFNVNQLINYDFQSNKTNSLELIVPIKYSDSADKLYTLKIKSLTVVDDSGHQASMKSEIRGDNMVIDYRIDGAYFPNITNFQIDYIAQGVVRFGLNEDYFFWNATSNAWPLTIKKTVVKVILPKKVVANVDQMKCLYGLPQKELKCRASVTEKAQSQLVFLFDNPFEIFSGESTRAYFTLPKGTIYEPGWLELLTIFINNNWISLIPLPILLIFIIIWRQRGRDPRSSGAVEVQVAPPTDMTPAEIGTVLDEKANAVDVMAELFYLASKGYLKITRVFNQTTDDFILTKLTEIKYSEPEYQQTILATIFAKGNQVNLSDLNSSFENNRASIYKQIYHSTVIKGLFPHSPARVRAFYASIALVMILGGSYTSVIYFDSNLYGMISSIVTGVLIFLISFAMPRRTKKGVSSYEKILGFKFFLMGGTENNVNALARNQFQFENYLAYSFVLGVEKDWAYQYKNIALRPLNWYEDSTITENFNALLLIDSMSSCCQAMKEHLFK